jgi:hypothetical protein
MRSVLNGRASLFSKAGYDQKVMNKFSYIVGATTEVQQGLISWQIKIREYLELYYQGDKENAKNTVFFNCIQKVEALNEALDDPDNLDLFRGVRDDQELLSAACIIQVTQIEINNQNLTGLAIDILTSAPWNTITHPKPEKRKGAATSLIEGIVRESVELEFNGIVKAITIPSARQFYRSIGFVETNSSGEMILTPDTAAIFLIDQEQRRQSRPFD